MRNANEMENTVFQKVQTLDEYRAMVAKFIRHMQGRWKKFTSKYNDLERTFFCFLLLLLLLTTTGQKNKKQQSEAMDPINALQHLTNQGTRNPMPAQMMAMSNQMGMGNTNSNPNVLQNLINVCSDECESF